MHGWRKIPITMMLVVVILAPVADPLLACAQTSRQHPVSCHVHAKPLPKPVSHVCCEAGHQAPLRREAAAFRLALVRVSVVAHTMPGLRGPAEQPAGKQPLPFHSPPELVSLRI